MKRKHFFFIVALIAIPYIGIQARDLFSLRADLYSVDEGLPQLQVSLEETVEKRKELVREILQRKSVIRRDIYERAIDEVGANGIISVITSLNPTCHDEGHDLGKVIYARLGSVGEALRTCQDACYSGCMHGVLMERFTEGSADYEHVELSDMRPQIQSVCESDALSSDYLYGDCVHGVGHALMFMADYNVESALELCDQFDKTAEKYYCATGAYMEYVTGRDKEDENISTYYPCDQNRYSAACFRYKTVKLMPAHYNAGGSLGELIQDCMEMRGATRLGCFHGLGNAHAPFIAQTQVTASQVCEHGTPDDKYVCIEGFIERMAKYDPEAAAKTCASMEGDSKAICENARLGGLYNMKKDLMLYLQ